MHTLPCAGLWQHPYAPPRRTFLSLSSPTPLLLSSLPSLLLFSALLILTLLLLGAASPNEDHSAFLSSSRPFISYVWIKISLLQCRIIYWPSCMSALSAPHLYPSWIHPLDVHTAAPGPFPQGICTRTLAFSTFVVVVVKRKLFSRSIHCEL